MHKTSESRPFTRRLTWGTAALITPAFVVWAWNSALPEILGAPVIDYRNALGLVSLGVVLTVPFLLHRRDRRHGKVHAESGDSK